MSASLPPSPVVLADPAPAAVPERVVLRWSPPMAHGRLQVSATAAFDDLLADLPVGGDEITLHDLGVGAGTLHWRIARSGEPWGVASTVDVAPSPSRMPERPESPRPDASPVGVRLLSPVDGAPADATAAVFAWAADDDDESVVQVSRSRTFERPIEIATRGTSLVLHDTLPDDGAAHYWRVSTSTGWTAPARFRPTGPDAVNAWEEARAAARTAKDVAAEREHALTLNAVAEAQAPWRVATSSRGETAAILYVMLVSFVVTLVVVFRAIAVS